MSNSGHIWFTKYNICWRIGSSSRYVVVNQNSFIDVICDEKLAVIGTYRIWHGQAISRSIQRVGCKTALAHNPVSRYTRAIRRQRINTKTGIVVNQNAVVVHISHEKASVIDAYSIRIA